MGSEKLDFSNQPRHTPLPSILQSTSRTSGSSNLREINVIRQNQVEAEPSDPDMLSLRLHTRITFLTETKIKRNLWLPPNAFDSSLYIKEHQVFLKAVI